MNAFAMFAADEALRLANERIEGYRQQQAHQRLVAKARQHGRFRAIAAAVSSLRATLSAVDTDQALPALSNYPYRS